jgi:hypothetical protein
MAAVDWQLGTMYLPGGFRGLFSQPGGPNTTVFPEQVRASSNLLSIEPFTELSGIYIFGCGHSANEVYVFRDVNEDGIPTAILCCPVCSFVSRTITPYQDALMGNAGALLNSILYP